MRKNKTFSVFNITSMTLLTLVTVVFIFPFDWVITGAFKTRIDSLKLPPQWLPSNPTLES